MADKTGIEWTDATWNPLRGCTRVSAGCQHCYAETVAGRFSGPGLPYEGLTKLVGGERRWTGDVRLVKTALDQPLRWKTPRKIFVNSMSDLFHESVPDEWIDRIFAIMALAPRHTFQILTKRPERMNDYVSTRAGDYTIVLPDAARRAGATLLDCRDVKQIIWPLPNVWLGVSVENQDTADERIPLLLQTPAAKRFISAEPLLGPVSLTAIQAPRYLEEDYKTKWKFSCLDTGDYYWYDDGNGICDCGDGPQRDHRIDWVICGGESGAPARPMRPDWARSLRDQCTVTGVPFFFKQWGEWAPGECGNGGPTKSEQIATWWDDRWSFDTVTPRMSREMHRHDEPDLYRLGKRAAGSLLDGVQHHEFPA